MSVTVRSEEQARQAGAWARESGRGIDACPNYAMGEPGYVLRKAWRAGWIEKHVEMGREVATK